MMKGGMEGKFDLRPPRDPDHPILSDLEPGTRFKFPDPEKKGRVFVRDKPYEESSRIVHAHEEADLENKVHDDRYYVNVLPAAQEASA